MMEKLKGWKYQILGLIKKIELVRQLSSDQKSEYDNESYQQEAVELCRLLPGSFLSVPEQTQFW